MAEEDFVIEGLDNNVYENVPKPSEQGELVDSDVLNKFKKRKEAQELVQWVKTEYQKCKTNRKLEENDWYLQLAFYNGYQYHDWRTVNNKQVLQEEPNPGSVPRITVNRIEPIIRTEIAKTTSGQPSASVVPASNDEDDLLAANAAEQVWNYLYDKSKFQTRVLQRAEFWRAITGNGFIKTLWDPTVEIKEPRTEIDPLTTEKRVTQEVSARGDVDYEVVSPFHLFVSDLAQEDIEQQPYIFNVYTKSTQWVKTTFRDVLPKDFQPSKVTPAEIEEAALMDIRGVDSVRPDSTLVIEAWIKPGATPKLPKGGLVTIVDSEIVQYSDTGLPYAHGEYPFAHLAGIQTGKFYRRSVIRSLIPLQREYNRTRSQIIQAKNLMAKPQMMYQEGSADPRKISAKAGVWIPIRPGFQYPTPVPIQPLPNYVLQEVQQLTTDFEDISGQHQISQGQAGGGVTAATALSYLGERDDAYLTTIYNSIEAAIEKVARQSVSLFVQYVQTERLIKTVGSDGSYDAMMLTGADVASGTDIRVESGSALPTSKAARQSLITEWMKMGFITPNDGLRVLEMGMLKQYYNLIKIDENSAQRENLTMKRLDEMQIQQAAMEFENKVAAGDPSVMTQDPMTGEMMPISQPPLIPVNDWDNHAVHIEVHNRFRKSQTFELLPEAVKEEFQRHIALHQQAAQADMMQQMMMGAPAEAGPSGAPQGTPEQSGMTAEQLG